MIKLTSKQEDMIGDNAHHEKKLKKAEETE